MRILTTLAGAIAVLGLSACGGSNPGGGTRTLYVKAEAVSDGSSNGSWLAVEVREGGSEGQLITDAVVTIEGDRTGEFNLPWEGINWAGFRFGSYLKRNLEWDTGWYINVRRGDDGLDAYVAAPGITNITNPIGDTTFRRSEAKPLVVRWKDGEGRRAEIVNIDFERADADRDLSEDPMEVEIDYNRLTATDRERVTVRRQNRIDLEGGTPGSVFSATTHHAIQFRVE